MDVSIIIVNYNTKDLLKNCLCSVFDMTKDIDFEVIVSDNGSIDGSIEMIKSEFPHVILIENGENLGFGAANNRGLKIAQGEYILFLNSDTILLNNAVKLFFDYWESAEAKEKIGALGAWLIKNDCIIHSYGKYPTICNMVYTLFRSFISSLFGDFVKNICKRRKINLNALNLAEDKKIFGYVTGADLFVKNNGKQFFDERFFMYFEESDLQYNFVFKQGLETYILKAPVIVHFEGASDISFNEKRISYDFKRKSSIYYWISCLKYFRKNSTIPWSVLLLKILVLLVWIFPWNISKTSPFIKDMLKI